MTIDPTVSAMITAACKQADRIIFQLMGDRDDPYHSACSNEWYNTIISRMRSVQFLGINTASEIGLRFSPTGNEYADQHLYTCIEAATSTLYPLTHCPLPVQITDYVITYPK